MASTKYMNPDAARHVERVQIGLSYESVSRNPAAVDKRDTRA